MTPAEFKAWFEGFTEGMDGPPSIKQWEKIAKKVKSIDGTPLLSPVYVERYWPHYAPYLGPRWTTGTPHWVGAPPIVCGSGAGGSTSDAAGGTTFAASGDWIVPQGAETLTGLTVMTAIGRADAHAA